VGGKMKYKIEGKSAVIWKDSETPA
jgi:hypothetical protein